MWHARSLSRLPRHPFHGAPNWKPSGIPAPWSGDHGAVVSTGFPSSDAGRGSPPLPADRRSGHATPPQPNPHPKKNQVTGRYKPVAFTVMRPIRAQCSGLASARCQAGSMRPQDESLRRMPSRTFAVWRQTASVPRWPSRRSRRAMMGVCPVRFATWRLVRPAHERAASSVTDVEDYSVNSSVRYSGPRRARRTTHQVRYQLIMRFRVSPLSFAAAMRVRPAS